MLKRDLKILLLQIRNDPLVCQEEVESFAQHSGLNISQIDILNVFITPDFDKTIITPYHALLVGGSSDVSVLEVEKYPFVSSCQELLCYCQNINLPVFASCFGFQLAVMAFGGQILRDHSAYEMGTIPIQLSSLADDDPVFKDVPNNFLAVSVHQEKALSLPDCFDLLAYTENCCHAFKHRHSPFWAFQFHPEVDVKTLIQRLGVYQHKYTQGDEHYKSLIDEFSSTPDSHRLLAQFVNNVLLNKTYLQ
jgi:GMP synthase (glutamine-hydrolysing)